MDEYIITIIDSDKEVARIKNFAETIEELIDNIVCMEYIESIVSLTRKKDKKTWHIKDDVSLSLLREYRSKVDDSINLRDYLTGKEVLDEDN